jgi:hypothetical protein
MDHVSSAARPSNSGSNGGVLGTLLSLLLRGAGALLLAVLVLLEPIVQPALCAIALLAFATSVFFRFLVGDETFPFSGMLALSLICILLLALYYRVVRLLTFCN